MEKIPKKDRFTKNIFDFNNLSLYLYTQSSRSPRHKNCRDTTTLIGSG